MGYAAEIRVGKGETRSSAFDPIQITGKVHSTRLRG
jgi:hypothetical protein